MIKINDIFMYVLGALIVIGFFGTLIGLLTVEVPSGNEKALYLALGSLLSAFAGVVGYFYGSSAGSKQKTELLSK